MLLLAGGLLLVWGLELVGYICLTPALPQRAVVERPLFQVLGQAASWLAYSLSLLRAPLGLVPYLAKLVMQLGLRLRYEAWQTTYRREILNLLAEIANLGLTWWLLSWLLGAPAEHWWVFCCYLPLWAEAVRLLAERIPILFSAGWQCLPHRRLALYLQRRMLLPAGSVLGRYCGYYSLADHERAALVLRALKQRAAADPEVAQRLAYLQGFRVIPERQGLRGGLVRDVARGEVFIHGVWSNDPWLLSGIALRRAPWSFDPRYLARPFYYMSGSNRSMSLFVLRNARYSLPYALFQFGHEIRVGRLHFFYVVLRWLGCDIERKVWVDGTFQNDQWIAWLKKKLGRGSEVRELRPLYNDQEVLAELCAGGTGRLSAQQIAERYVYPLIYVEEMLLPQVIQRQEERDHEQYTRRAYADHQ